MKNRGGHRMKIPKYVEKLIERRRKLAYELIEVDAELDDWLEKRNKE